MAKGNNITLEEAREYLSFYIHDSHRLDLYIARLKAAPSLKEAERVLIPMIRNEEIPAEILTRQEFYLNIDAIIRHLNVSRSTLHDHFVGIQKAVKAKEPAAENQVLMNLLFSNGIEVVAPQPGEEMRYTVELILTASKEHGDRLLMSAVITNVERRKVDYRNFDGERFDSSGVCSYSLKGSPTQLSELLEYLASLFANDTRVEVQYKSTLLNRSHLSIAQALQLLSAEPH